MSSPLTFPATTSTGDAMQCINVSITDDSVFEESETFTVTVTTTTPRVTLGNDNTTVTIIDNEGQYKSLVYTVLPRVYRGGEGMQLS